MNSILLRLMTLCLALFLPFKTEAYQMESLGWHPPKENIEQLTGQLETLNERSRKLYQDFSASGVSMPFHSAINENTDSTAFQADAVYDSLNVLQEALSTNYEFLMGQNEVIVFHQSLSYVARELRLAQSYVQIFDQVVEERKPESDSYSGLYTSANGLLTDYDEVFSIYRQLLLKTDLSLKKLVAGHPNVKELQTEYLNNKELERLSSLSGNNVDLFQTVEDLKESLISRYGGTEEEIGKMISGKILEATQHLENVKNEMEQLSESAMNSEEESLFKKFRSKINYGGNFSVNRGNPASIDFMGNVSYRITSKWQLGAGLSYRSNLGTALDDINLKYLGWGYRFFADYFVLRHMYLELASESYKGDVIRNKTQGGLNSENEPGSFHTFLIGVGVEHQLSSNIKSRYSLLYSPKRTGGQFTSPWVVRFGLLINQKNQ